MWMKRNVAREQGVPSMYTIYTYYYMNRPNTIYYHWEPTNRQRLAEIRYVLSYYHSIKIIDGFTCKERRLDKSVMEELDILLAVKADRTVEKDNYNAVMSVLPDATASDDLPSVEAIAGVLGYVILFGQRWYIPLFDAKTLEVKPVPSHLHAATLLAWYEKQLTMQKSWNMVLSDRRADCKGIWESLDRLIERAREDSSSAQPSEST